MVFRTRLIVFLSTFSLFSSAHAIEIVGAPAEGFERLYTFANSQEVSGHLYLKLVGSEILGFQAIGTKVSPVLVQQAKFEHGSATILMETLGATFELQDYGPGSRTGPRLTEKLVTEIEQADFQRHMRLKMFYLLPADIGETTLASLGLPKDPKPQQRPVQFGGMPLHVFNFPGTNEFIYVQLEPDRSYRVFRGEAGKLRDLSVDNNKILTAGIGGALAIPLGNAQILEIAPKIGLKYTHESFISDESGPEKKRIELRSVEDFDKSIDLSMDLAMEMLRTGIPKNSEPVKRLLQIEGTPLHVFKVPDSKEFIFIEQDDNRKYRVYRGEPGKMIDLNVDNTKISVAGLSNTLWIPLGNGEYLETGSMFSGSKAFIQMGRDGERIDLKSVDAFPEILEMLVRGNKEERKVVEFQKPTKFITVSGRPEYLFAVPDQGKILYVEEINGKGSFRGFYGVPDNYKELKVVSFARARDGGTTYITFEDGSKMYSPVSLMGPVKTPTYTIGDETFMMDRLNTKAEKLAEVGFNLERIEKKTPGQPAVTPPGGPATVVQSIFKIEGLDTYIRIDSLGDGLRSVAIGPKGNLVAEPVHSVEFLQGSRKGQQIIRLVDGRQIVIKPDNSMISLGASLSEGYPLIARSVSEKRIARLGPVRCSSVMK